MLKIATLDDFELVKKMASNFLEVSGYKDMSDEDTVDNVIYDLITRQEGVILLHGEAGMLAGTVAKFPFGRGYIATEVAWWVEPDARKTGVGKELLEAFEHWASLVGAKHVHMVSLDESVGKYYEKQGYKLYERAYLKGI